MKSAKGSLRFQHLIVLSILGISSLPSYALPDVKRIESDPARIEELKSRVDQRLVQDLSSRLNISQDELATILAREMKVARIEDQSQALLDLVQRSNYIGRKNLTQQDIIAADLNAEVLGLWVRIQQKTPEFSIGLIELDKISKKYTAEQMSGLSHILSRTVELSSASSSQMSANDAFALALKEKLGHQELSESCVGKMDLCGEFLAHSPIPEYAKKVVDKLQLELKADGLSELQTQSAIRALVFDDRTMVEIVKNDQSPQIVSAMVHILKNSSYYRDVMKDDRFIRIRENATEILGGRKDKASLDALLAEIQYQNQNWKSSPYPLVARSVAAMVGRKEPEVKDLAMKYLDGNADWDVKRSSMLILEPYLGESAVLRIFDKAAREPGWRVGDWAREILKRNKLATVSSVAQEPKSQSDDDIQGPGTPDMKLTYRNSITASRLMLGDLKGIVSNLAFQHGVEFNGVIDNGIFERTLNFSVRGPRDNVLAFKKDLMTLH